MIVLQERFSCLFSRLVCLICRLQVENCLCLFNHNFLESNLDLNYYPKTNLDPKTNHITNLNRNRNPNPNPNTNY